MTTTFTWPACAQLPSVRTYLPEQTASDGSVHRGSQWWPDFWVDTWPRMAIQVVLGAGVLWCAPRIVGFLTTIDRMLIVTMLSSGSLAEATGRDRADR